MRVRTKVILNSSGFSMTEALVASIIFVTASAGVFGVVSIMQNSTTDQEFLAVKKGQEFLESLSRRVDYNEYQDNLSPLDPGTYTNVDIGDGCTADYEVVEVDEDLTNPITIGSRKVENLQVTCP